jgi:hypothetical protein
VWDIDLADAVTELVRLFETTTPYGIWFDSIADLVDQVAAALD